MILSAEPETTTATITAMPSTETHGSTGSKRSTTRGSVRRTTSPASTGRRTIRAIDVAMAAPSSGIYAPASHSVRNGVSSGASSVEMDVMVTDTATSPRAR